MTEQEQEVYASTSKIGKRIERQRIALDISKTKMCSNAQISIDKYNDWLRNKSSITTAKLKKILDQLDLELDVVVKQVMK